MVFDLDRAHYKDFPWFSMPLVMTGLLEEQSGKHRADLRHGEAVREEPADDRASDKGSLRHS